MPGRRIEHVSAEILLVEDDDDLRSELVDVLRAAGHSVNAVANGKDALAMLAGSRLTPSLIILDLNLPVLDGWELLAILRSYKRLVKIPVIVMTGVEPERAAQAASEPFVTVLRKPFDLSRLLAIVSSTLRSAEGNP